MFFSSVHGARLKMRMSPHFITSFYPTRVVKFHARSDNYISIYKWRQL
jgi:hypothetical protein